MSSRTDSTRWRKQEKYESLASADTRDSCQSIRRAPSSTNNQYTTKKLGSSERTKDGKAKAQSLYNYASTERRSIFLKDPQSSKSFHTVELNNSVLSKVQESSSAKIIRDKALSRISRLTSPSLAIAIQPAILPALISCPVFDDRSEMASNHQSKADYLSRIPGRVKHVPDVSVLKGKNSKTESLLEHKPTRSQMTALGKLVPQLPHTSKSSSGDMAGSQKSAFAASQHFLARPKGFKSETVSQTNPNHDKPASLSHESSQSQIELLHLHLLHKSAGTVQSQWQYSAEKHYQKRFSKLVDKNTELNLRESIFQQAVNVESLQHWCRGASDAKVADKMYGLSDIIHETLIFVGPEGKYTYTVKAFDDWYEIVCTIRNIKPWQQVECSAAECFGILEGVGDGWRVEATLLEREIARLLKGLHDLGWLDEGSDLAHVLELLTVMLTNMLEELEVMWDIEEHVLCREKSGLNKSTTNIT
ncbi:hypothetical protein MMC06_003045 [Schaereria dolodes]|nr:hypothetical protein [Schaereria dolodes]